MSTAVTPVAELWSDTRAGYDISLFTVTCAGHEQAAGIIAGMIT